MKAAFGFAFNLLRHQYFVFSRHKTAALSRKLWGQTVSSLCCSDHWKQGPILPSHICEVRWDSTLVRLYHMNSKLLRNCQALTKASLFTEFLRIEKCIYKGWKDFSVRIHTLMYLCFTDLVRTETQKISVLSVFKHIFLLELLLVQKTGTQVEGPPLLLWKTTTCPTGPAYPTTVRN